MSPRCVTAGGRRAPRNRQAEASDRPRARLGPRERRAGESPRQSSPIISGGYTQSQSRLAKTLSSRRPPAGAGSAADSDVSHLPPLARDSAPASSWFLPLAHSAVGSGSGTMARVAGPHYLPTPAQIRAQCVAIRQRWTPAERRRRAVGYLEGEQAAWLPPQVALAGCLARVRKIASEASV